MKANRLVGLVGVVLAAVMLGGMGVPIAADAGGEHHAHFMACAKVCGDCALQCDSCYHHCMQKVTAGQKEHAKSMGLCVDCAEFCRLAATLSARESNVAKYACESCAKSCDVCAVSCESFKDDKHMAECARACRDCAKACREMIKMVKQ